jgi:hypothetical protein
MLMRNPSELKDLEQKNYKATHSDGILDVFIGVSLIVIGAAWIVTPDWMSGVVALVAVFISPMLKRRRRFLETRTGYVMFTEPRRLWERRIYTTTAVLFGGFMILARPLGALQPGEVDWRVSPDSLVVWLLAAVAVVLAVLTKLNRLYGYALVLAVAGVAPAITDDSFGWPLLISGVVITAVGSALLRRFVNQHPRIQTQ